MRPVHSERGPTRCLHGAICVLPLVLVLSACTGNPLVDPAPPAGVSFYNAIGFGETASGELTLYNAVIPVGEDAKVLDLKRTDGHVLARVQSDQNVLAIKTPSLPSKPNDRVWSAAAEALSHSWSALDTGFKHSIHLTAWAIPHGFSPEFETTITVARDGDVIPLTVAARVRHDDSEMAQAARLVNQAAHELAHIAHSASLAQDQLSTEIAAHFWGRCAEWQFARIVGARPVYDFVVEAPLRSQLDVRDGKVQATAESTHVKTSVAGRAAMVLLLEDKVGTHRFDTKIQHHLDALSDYCSRVSRGVPDFTR